MIMARLRAVASTCPPPDARLFFVGRDAYLIGPENRCECLTSGAAGQLAMIAVLTDFFGAEVRGRIATLEARRELPVMMDRVA